MSAENKTDLSLMDEFEKLIMEVTHEIIDNALIDDLKSMRSDLSEQLNTLKTNHETLLNQIQVSDQILEKSKTQITSSLQTTLSSLSEFSTAQKEKLDHGFKAIIEQMSEHKTLVEALFNSGHEKVSNALHEEFTSGQEHLSDAFHHTTNKIKSLIEETTNLIENKNEVIQNNLEKLYQGSIEAYNKMIEKTTSQFNQMLNERNELLNSEIRILDQERNSAYGNHVESLKQLFNGYESQLSHILEKSEKQIDEEISQLREYLSNGEKLIGSNQKRIIEIQRSIEDKLNNTLVSIVEEANTNKTHIENGIHAMDTLVEKVNKELFRLTELNNAINIKMDHNIQKMKSLEKNNKRTLIIASIFGGIVTVGVIVNIILTLGG
ncbi:MAG: hypothetical protein JXR88_00130 [Clostridia bacterium]|nr:hypothetical protein [Clostridia bacterium]